LEEARNSVFRLAAPKGAIDNAALTVCLKAYPDTNLEFFRSLFFGSRCLFQNIMR